MDESLERRVFAALPPVGGVFFFLLLLGVLFLRLGVAAGAVEEGGFAFGVFRFAFGAADDAGEAHRENGAHLLQQRLVVGRERALGVAEEDQRGQALAEVGAVHRDDFLALEQGHFLRRELVLE